MTNKGFYSDKLLAVALKGSCTDLHELVFGEECSTKTCMDCEFSDADRIVAWLNAEREEPEPPLLENGDGLKLGDQIMVRNDADEPWTKVQFLAYIGGVFYTAGPVTRGAFKANRHLYLQARLPMEGEQ